VRGSPSRSADAGCQGASAVFHRRERRRRAPGEKAGGTRRSGHAWRPPGPQLRGPWQRRRLFADTGRLFRSRPPVPARVPRWLLGGFLRRLLAGFLRRLLGGLLRRLVGGATRAGVTVRARSTVRTGSTIGPGAVAGPGACRARAAALARCHADVDAVADVVAQDVARGRFGNDLSLQLDFRR